VGEGENVGEGGAEKLALGVRALEKDSVREVVRVCERVDEAEKEGVEVAQVEKVRTCERERETESVPEGDTVTV